MSNNYQQWSEILTFVETHPFEEQKEWVEATLEGQLHIPGLGCSCLEALKKAMVEQGIDLSGVDEETLEDWPDFEHDVVGGGVDIYSEEGGNLSHVAAFIQGFLKKFNPTEVFKLTWAETCDKMKAGEFSGGGVYITATEIHWFDPHAEFDRLDEERKAK